LIAGGTVPIAWSPSSQRQGNERRTKWRRWEKGSSMPRWTRLWMVEMSPQLL
jgi:hypothetical protein